MKKINLLKTIALTIGLILFVSTGWGQTAGDVAIIGVNTDATKSIAFVALADIPANTTLTFTDNAWTTANGPFASTEGAIEWTHTSAVSAGTVVTITLGTPYTVNVGSISNNTNFNLSSSGDQIFVLNGTWADRPTNNGNDAKFLYVFSIENFITTGSTSSNTSYLPAALASYSAAMTTSSTEVDNAYFANGSTAQTAVSVSGTKAELLVLLNDESLYYSNNTGPLTFPTYTITVNSGSIPVISVTPTELNDFEYIEGAGPSVDQSFEISGTNLTNNIEIIPSAIYEISEDGGGSFVSTNLITLLQSSGTVNPTTIYVRLKAGLIEGMYMGEIIAASSLDADDKEVTCNGNVVSPPRPEPDEHVTSFYASAQSHSKINLTWDDAVGTTVPDGYLIKWSTVSYGDIIPPSDYTPEADGSDAHNVSFGELQYLWTGLSASTTYFFRIFPYSNSGSDIDYKTDGFLPEATATTPAAPEVVVHFDFENTTKTSAITSDATWISNPYTADYGSADNVDIAYFELNGGPLFSGWNSTQNSPNTTTWDNGAFTKGWVTKVSTRGYSNLTLSSVQRSSNTGPADFRVQGSLDGNIWSDLPGIGNITVQNDFISGTVTELSLPASYNNLSELYLRWLMVSNIAVNGSAVAGTGTSTIDDIIINGYAISDGTYNTVTIDGTNAGWQASELFPNVTNADNFHFTWDENFIYLGISGAEAGFNNMATFLFLNTHPDDINFGSTDVYMWGQNIKAPFKATNVLVFKNGTGGVDDYMEFLNWDGTQWVSAGFLNDNNYAGVLHFEIGNAYREIMINRSVLGVENNGDKVKVASVTEQQWGANWRYFGWPSEGWVDGARAAGQTLTHAYLFELKEFVLPNDASNLRRDIFFAENTTLSTSETYDMFTIEPDVNVTIEAGQNISINGDFNIRSDVNGTGSFIDLGTFSVAGQTNVYKYLSNTTTAGWYLSAPVLNPGHWVLSSNSDGLYAFDASSALWLNWSGVLEPMKGFVTRYDTYGSDITVNFNGSQLNTGALSRTDFVRTGVGSGNFGWNLTGNPYPSPIDWDLVVAQYGDNNAFVAATQLNAAIHIRKYDGSVHTYLPNVLPADPGRIVPAMQAFWVQVNDAFSTGQLALNNTVRAHGINNTYKAVAPTDILRLNIESNGNTDNTTVYFKDAATDQFDAAYDGVKLLSDNDAHPQIYSFDADNQMLAINALSTLNEAKSVDLGFNTRLGGQFVLSTDINSINANVSVYLEDTETNTMINLNDQNSYAFNANIGEFTDRFVLHFAPITLNTTNSNTIGNQVSIYSSQNSIFISNVSDDNSVVYIYDMLGKLVESAKLSNSTLNKINVNLTSGHYLVNVVSNTNNISEKVFIR